MREPTPIQLPLPRANGHRPARGAPGPDERPRPAVDLTKVLTTAELVAGAVLVADRLARRPGSAKAVVQMGPGGWVSMKGGRMAVRPARRGWRRLKAAAVPAPARRPWWARLISATALDALLR
jgi:hypothetical protein